MRTRLYIYGAGGLGREVLALVKQMETWEPAGFIDDALAGKEIKGLKIIGGAETLTKLGDAQLVIAIGNPFVKEKVAQKLPKNIVCPVITHPSAQLMDPSSIRVGAGCIITAGVILTTEISIGDHVLINLNTTIGHDVNIRSYSSLMPGVNVAGEVSIGARVLVGSGSNIRNGVSIADNCRVGMGAVVIKNVQEGQTVVGVPAKPL